MQTTHSSHFSVVLVAKAAPNADITLIRFLERLQSHIVIKGRNNKMQTPTHSSVVSVVLVARAAPNTDTSLIWLPQRLQRQ